MNSTEILLAIDEEISRLTQVRSLLGGLDIPVAVLIRLKPDAAPRRGRPKGSKNKATSFNPSEFSPLKRRTMRPEGKARVAAAQRARHAGAETPKTEERSTTVANARLIPPSKISSEASAVRKSPSAVNRAAAKPAPAKKPNRVKVAPAKSATPSRTRIASKKKTAPKVSAGSQTVKRTAAKSSQPKPTPPRPSARKTAVSIKAISRMGAPPDGTSGPSAPGE